MEPDCLCRLGDGPGKPRSECSVRVMVMKQFPVDQLPVTHVVADQRHCLTFNKATNFAQVTTVIDATFDFVPASLHDLVNVWTTHRPDLLIGSLSPDSKVLTVLGDRVSLDPGCSVVARQAAHLLKIESIRRILMTGLQYDVWHTPIDAMRGRIPSILYHGTSDIYIDRIWAEGLRIDQKPNWSIGSRERVCMSATPQTAAFHARRTAENTGGEPIVVAFRKPWLLKADWDVVNQLVNNPHVPGDDAMRCTTEAGLFASTRPASRTAILEILTPKISVPVREWPRIRSADWRRRIFSWVWR